VRFESNWFSAAFYTSKQVHRGKSGLLSGQRLSLTTTPFTITSRATSSPGLSQAHLRIESFLDADLSLDASFAALDLRHDPFYVLQFVATLPEHG